MSHVEYAGIGFMVILIWMSVWSKMGIDPFEAIVNIIGAIFVLYIGFWICVGVGGMCAAIIGK